MRQARTQAIWRLSLGLAQIVFATATVVSLIAGALMWVVAIGALLTLAAIVTSLALWRGR